MRLITLITAGLLLGGCAPPPRETREKQTAEQVRTAEQQTALERQRREQTEIRLREQEARTSRWQFAAAVAVSAVGFALILGTILGSRARHDTEQ